MGYEEETTVNLGLPYYDSLLPEEQQEVTEAVKLLLRQTFVLERKYEKRSGRFTNNREFRINFIVTPLPRSYSRERNGTLGSSVKQSSKPRL